MSQKQIDEIVSILTKHGIADIENAILNAVDETSCHVLGFGEVDHFGAVEIRLLMAQLSPKLWQRGFRSLCLEASAQFQSAMTQFQADADIVHLAQVICPKLPAAGKLHAYCLNRFVIDLGFSGKYHPSEDNVSGFVEDYEKMLCTFQQNKFNLRCIDAEDGKNRDQHMAMEILEACKLGRVVWIGGSRHMIDRGNSTETNELLLKSDLKTFTIAGFQPFMDYPEHLKPTTGLDELIQILKKLPKPLFVPTNSNAALRDLKAMESKGDVLTFGSWNAGIFYPLGS